MPDTQELFPVASTPTGAPPTRTSPLVARFGRLSGPQRAAVIAAAVLVCAGLAWCFRPRESEYATLVRAVDLSDASDITKTLKEQKIAYRLEDEGATILVPKDSIYDTRILIAGKGLPHNGATGFELFDRNNLAVSEFSERVSWQRALQGELARTIQEIDGVEHARVHLTLPQDEVFAETRKSASAAVTLRIARGRDLTNENVAAIVALVSRSVPGLDAEHVSVVTQHGRVLWNPSADAKKRHADDDVTDRLQHSLEERVTTLLTPLVGEDRCQVRVAADLDLAEKDVQTSRVLRDTAPRSRQTADETYSAARPEDKMLPEQRASTSHPESIRSTKKDTGSLQTDTNSLQSDTNSLQRDKRSTHNDTISLQNDSKAREHNTAGSEVKSPPGFGPAPSPQSDYGRHSETVTYEVGTETAHQVIPGGRIRRLNVAVLLDEEAARALSVVRVETLVSEAVGLDRARGDKLTVQTMPFRARAAADDPPTPQKAPAPAQEAANPFAYLAVVGVLLLPLAFIKRRPSPPTHVTRLEPRPHNDPARTAALLKSWMNTEEKSDA